jgi:hypothetical protein
LGTDAGQTYNCTILGGGYHESLGRSWVGYFGDRQSNPVLPAVNQPYYTKVGWGVSGFPCGNGGAYVHVEIGLPAGTELAISNTNKVRCWHTAPYSEQWKEVVNGCPQQPQNGQKGGLAFDPSDGTPAWPTATGTMWEIYIPVKSTQPLNGLTYDYPTPCPACYMAGVWMIDGNYAPWSFPKIGVAVSGAAATTPSISYPTPSMTDESYNPDTGTSEATMNGYAYSNGTTGQVWFMIGKTTNYEEFTSQKGNLSPAGDYHWWLPLIGIQPGQTYHWRMCYDATSPDKAVVCGADQTFTAAPAPDNVAPTTSILKGPSGTIAKRTANFTFDSNETNVQYECKLDGAADFTPCPLGTKPMYKELAQGQHTLLVKAKDGVGNTDATPASRTWKVDTIAPDTSITAGPTGTVTARKAEFKFKSPTDTNVKFLCARNTAPFKACTSPKTYSDLPKGEHTFKVKAKDVAGNVDATPAKRTWTIK